MIRRTIEVATAGARLSIRYGQLIVARPELPDESVPVEDIGILVLDSDRALYSHAVFSSVLEAGGVVMLSGADHHPVGLMLPTGSHHMITKYHRAQVSAAKPVTKRAWQQIVQAKIRQQGRALVATTGTDGGFTSFAASVRSGDPDNKEAQAARRYWSLLFGKGFRRDRHASGTNAILNYGYSVVRAATARAVVLAGLIPTLGVGHYRRSNPFCLADDLLEPYRPIADLVVKGIEGDLGCRENRRRLLSILTHHVQMTDGNHTPLSLAVQFSAASMRRVLTGEAKKLVLPSSVD